MHKITKKIYKEIWKERNTETSTIIKYDGIANESRASKQTRNTEKYQKESDNITETVSAKLDIWQDMYQKYSVLAIYIAKIII